MEFRPQLKKPFLFSLIIHLVILIFILFVPKFGGFDHNVKVVWVNIPKGVSEEIDTKIKEAKELPQTTVKEQKEWQKEPVKEEQKTKLTTPQKKEAVKPAKPVLKPRKLTDIEKAMAALSKKKIAPPEAAQVKDKGEGFKYGTGSEALRVPPTDPEYLAYQAKVRFKIIQEWILPLSYAEGPITPRSRVVVEINEKGEIISKEWDSKSGNAAFDSSCLRAVERSSPLPVPPERLKWEAYNEGFLVEFDPSLKGK